MLNDFDNIELKPEDDLEVETKREPVKNGAKPVVTKLKTKNGKKIKKVSAKNNSDKQKLKELKKQYKKRKGVKRKVLAWGLGLAVFAGVGFGVKSAISGGPFNGSYISQVKSRYEMVDETLTNRLSQDITMFKIIKDRNITTVKFEESENSKASLKIYYQGKEELADHFNDIVGNAVYNVPNVYYENLADAEETGNMIDYLDCLNDLFDKMSLISESSNVKINSMLGLSYNELYEQKIHELFGLDFEKEGIVKQIGFLPLSVESVSWDGNGNGIDYTYKLSGISYCETTFESHDEIKKGQDYVGEISYDKDHVKAYYRDLTLSSSEIASNFPEIRTQLYKDAENYAYGKKSKEDFKIETTYFQDADIYNAFQEYLNMREGNFDYQK